MSFNEYMNRFESELEDMWNDSARFQYLNWDAFCRDMYNKFKDTTDEQ